MVTHIVFWKFDKEEDLLKAKRDLEMLPSKIAQIISFEVGIDFNRSAVAFDLALYSTFATREDLTAYQIHEDHKVVAAFIGSVATERSVVDYEM